MNIAFVGDLFLGEEIKGKKFKMLVDDFNSSKFKIANLEQALGDFESQEKSQVWSHPSMAQYLSFMEIDAVNLANNHIHDLGYEGFKSTINTLKKHEIQYFGAGFNSEEASRPLKIDEKIYCLAYCQKSNSYLKSVKISNSDSWGVRHLSLENIKSDLNSIPEGCKVIILMHWGIEHLLMVDYELIELSKEILKLDKVLHIIGTHPHVIQGEYTERKKKVFFSTGNFLFPNFGLNPPSVTGKINNTKYKTYGYHNVFKPTNKFWSHFNRLGLCLVLDSNSLEIKKTFIKQHKTYPIVSLPNVMERIYCSMKYKLSSMLIKWPKMLYSPLLNIYRKIFYISRNIKMRIFKFRQLGIKNTIKYLNDR